MSADHRKPVVAFVVLAFAAAAIVGVQRADAQAGRFLAAVIGSSARVQGALTLDAPPPGEAGRASAFGPVFGSLDGALQGDRSEPLRIVLPAEKRPRIVLPAEKRRVAEATPAAAVPEAAARETGAPRTAAEGGQGHSRSRTGHQSPVAKGRVAKGQAADDRAADDRAADDRAAHGHHADRPQQAASGRQTARSEQARLTARRKADDRPAAGPAASRGTLHHPGQRPWTRAGFTASDRSSR